MSQVYNMLERAKLAMSHAYAPYSNFNVGVCIRTENNNLYVGCNYENASFSLTYCAEASAIGTMIAAGDRRIVEVVVIGSSELPCVPCGSCRQRIREFAALDIPVHMFSSQNNGVQLTMTLDELLPNSFGPHFFTNNVL